MSNFKVIYCENLRIASRSVEVDEKKLGLLGGLGKELETKDFEFNEIGIGKAAADLLIDFVTSPEGCTGKYANTSVEIPEAEIDLLKDFSGEYNIGILAHLLGSLRVKPLVCPHTPKLVLENSLADQLPERAPVFTAPIEGAHPMDHVLEMKMSEMSLFGPQLFFSTQQIYADKKLC